MNGESWRHQRSLTHHSQLSRLGIWLLLISIMWFNFDFSVLIDVSDNCSSVLGLYASLIKLTKR